MKSFFFRFDRKPEKLFDIWKQFRTKGYAKMDYSDIKDDVLNVTYWKKENRFNEDGFFVTKWTHLKRRKITVKEL